MTACHACPGWLACMPFSDSPPLSPHPRLGDRDLRVRIEPLVTNLQIRCPFKGGRGFPKQHIKWEEKGRSLQNEWEGGPKVCKTGQGGSQHAPFGVPLKPPNKNGDQLQPPQIQYIFSGPENTLQGMDSRSIYVFGDLLACILNTSLQDTHAPKTSRVSFLARIWGTRKGLLQISSSPPKNKQTNQYHCLGIGDSNSAEVLWGPPSRKLLGFSEIPTLKTGGDGFVAICRSAVPCHLG